MSAMSPDILRPGPRRRKRDFADPGTKAPEWDRITVDDGVRPGSGGAAPRILPSRREGGDGGVPDDPLCGGPHRGVLQRGCHPLLHARPEPDDAPDLRGDAAARRGLPDPADPAHAPPVRLVRGPAPPVAVGYFFVGVTARNGYAVPFPDPNG